MIGWAGGRTRFESHFSAAEPSVTDPKRELLRHTLATVAYRGGKALRDAPATFASYSAGPGTRTPGEILAHVGDLFDWAFWLCRGERRWAASRSRTTISRPTRRSPVRSKTCSRVPSPIP